MMVAAIHPLTPGSPAYAVLKVSAVGGLIALRVLMSRRVKRNDDHVATESAPAPVEDAPVVRQHPVSRRKRKKRRRRA
jgi:hypothetical protein